MILLAMSSLMGGGAGGKEYEQVYTSTEGVGSCAQLVRERARELEEGRRRDLGMAVVYNHCELPGQVDEIDIGTLSSM